jgi:hypothetical protein
MAASRRRVDPDAADYFARIVAAGSTISEPNKAAVNAFVFGCKADGIWTAIKASCLLAGPDDLTGALVPLVGPAPLNTNGNFVEADYSRFTGLKSSGGDSSTSKRLNPQRLSSADPQDNCSLSVWVTDSSELADLHVLIGAGSGTSAGTTHLRARGVGTIEFRSRSGSGSSTSGAWTGTGFLGHSRASSSGYTRRFNSTSSAISNASSAPFAAHQVFAASQTTAAAFNATSNVRLAFYHIGESLDLALLDARLATYMSALT